MPTTNFTKVTTSLQPTPAAPANWIEIAAIPVDAGDVPDGFDTKAYTSVQEMIDDGWTSSDDAVVTATNYFGQGDYNGGQVPVKVVVIKRGAPVAQVYEFDVLTTTDGDYKLFIDGVLAATLAAVGLTDTQIKDQLITAFNAGAFGSTHTAATVDTNSGTVTADVLGVPFILTATGPGVSFDVDQTVANVGIYQDLDAAWAIERFWQVLPDPAEAEGTLLEVSRWCQAGESWPTRRRNVCILPTMDADILTSTEPNFADTLIGLNRTCSFALYHVNTSDKMNGSWSGRYIKMFPGSKAWHYGRVNGTSLTSTINFDHDEGEALVDARCSWVERDGSSTTDFVYIFGGVGAGGFTLAQKMAEHAWWLRCDEAMKTVQQAGLDLDEIGLAQIKSAILIASQPFIDAGVLDESSIVITPVPLASVPAAELAVGDYLTTGGVNVSGVITPKLHALRVSSVFAVAP